MYEKKNKLTQQAPILDEISVRLSKAVHRYINKNSAFFFKALIFDGYFWRYRLIMPLSIYDRFLSNNIVTNIVRLRQHFWQIYLIGQTKAQNFVSWGL